MIIVSSEIHIPKPLEKLVTILELDLPDEKEIKDIINGFIQETGISEIPEKFLDDMTIAFKGITESEIKDLLGLSVSRDGELTEKALQLILDQKQQLILKAGILEMIPLKGSMADIGGLENLKDWLQKKAKVFKNMKSAEEFGVTMPKGVLIAGVPGCGKSLTAKAAGKLFDVPLLRLDMGRLMGKYVGESEENMRKAIRLAEAISPCVLWVDELEKAFAGIGGGGGAEVTTRLFGAFLTWMQEKKSAAFVVAAANDIMKLPPELLRKGRFDEIFYVPLPAADERRKIFEIHLNKRRKKDAAEIDVDKLVEETEGYSDADIEGVVGESVENVFVSEKGKHAMKNYIFGYARVSTKAQNLDRQIDALEKYGVDQIYNEKMTGTRKDRPELAKLIDRMTEGDVVVIESLSRLGRSTKDLIELTELFQSRGVHLVSLKENIDTSTSTGKPQTDHEAVRKALKLYHTGQYSIREIEEMTGVKRSTLYRNLKINTNEKR